MSNCITTYTKINFNPIQPHIDDIMIDDIAHALSLICRANGHFPIFYSVAQHCVYCCEEALSRGYHPTVALACLLHDASEAYISDITRPVKPHLSNYLELESHLQNLIYQKYIPHTLSDQDFELVNTLDNLLLHHEFIHFTDKVIPTHDTTLHSYPKFEFIDFALIESRYKELFYKLKLELVASPPYSPRKL